MRTFFFLLGILTLVSLGATLNTRERTSYPEKMLIFGLPAWGPTLLRNPQGEEIPAGCGPEAARLLLLYYDLVFWTSFVREDPEFAISELHGLMGTLTVEWRGLKQGLTWPWAFRAGLRAYIEAHSDLPVQVHTFTGGLGGGVLPGCAVAARRDAPGAPFRLAGRRWDLSHPLCGGRGLRSHF